MNRLSAVTGAFGYTGKYIARLLLEEGQEVITLTGHPQNSLPEFAGRVRAVPFHFDRTSALVESLSGVTTLYNTYWVRFDHGAVTYERAVANSRVLFQAARAAGVERVVHVSITNPAPDSSLPYFRGKALVEDALRGSGLSYAILRPTVLFGREDILINNIAWLLRRFPLFPVPGDGEYRLQPVFVGDLARLALEMGRRNDNLTLDAVGPDVFTFNELLALISRTVDSKSLKIHLPPSLALWLSRAVGLALGDVVLTRDEVAGLAGGLLVSSAAPTAQTSLAGWLEANREILGLHYASEIERHYRQGI